MMNEQVTSTLNRFKATYSNNPLKSDEVARKEYANAVKPLDYAIMKRATDKLLRTCEFFPTIARILDAYTEIETIERKNEEYRKKQESSKDIQCYICMDKGFVLYTEIINKIPYQFVAHCTCLMGDTAQYDGRRKSKEKTDYHTTPIAQILDTNELRRSNRSAHNSPVCLGDKEVALFKKIGFKIPDRLIRGDAWEGDEECPF